MIDITSPKVSVIVILVAVIITAFALWYVHKKIKNDTFPK